MYQSSKDNSRHSTHFICIFCIIFEIFEGRTSNNVLLDKAVFCYRQNSKCNYICYMFHRKFSCDHSKNEQYTANCRLSIVDLILYHDCDVIQQVSFYICRSLFPTNSPRELSLISQCIIPSFRPELSVPLLKS